MKIVLGFLLTVLTINAYTQRVEAEEGDLQGTVIENSRSGYSGTGYVTGFDQDNDAVTLTITVEDQGLYELKIGYAAPHGYKENDIYINGSYVGSQEFPESTSFNEISFGKILLEKGENTVKVVKTWGYFDLDYIHALPAVPNNYRNVSENLVNENATFEATVLYQFLKDHYGHRIISGQQGGNTEFSYIEQHTGKIPAMRGFDLIDYSPSRVERGTTSDETESAIDWWKQGGIVSLMWHWNAPKDLVDSGDWLWWRGFYTEGTTFDPSIAMNNTESEEYELIIRDIDVIAEELQLISETKAPVLWRPLHEAEGGWFWWGAKGPEICVWLWKLMYDRLTNHHGLNNLIWVWTGTGSDEAMDWYPGDEYVDIIGADIYLADGNYSTSFSLFDEMAGIHSGKKIVTLSETGTIPDAGKLDEEKARWSWFMVWSGEFITDGKKNDVAHLNKVYNHDYVLTFDELPDFYNYESPDFPDDEEDDDGTDEEILGMENNLILSGYPNPTLDHVTLSLKDHGLFDGILVYDLHGHLLEMIPVIQPAEKVNMDFSAYPPGIYVVKFFSVEKKETIRIQKL